MLKTTSCTPLNGYLPAELHGASYSLGIIDLLSQAWYTKLGGSFATTFRVLSAGGAQRLHPKEALRNPALRHAEQRAITLSLVAMSTTFVYLLMV
jgi:hypothetical protein